MAQRKIKQIEMKMPRERKKSAPKKKEKRMDKFVKRIKELADVITAVGIIGAALVGLGVWTINQVNAGTNERLDAVVKKIDKIEMDSTRSQLLTLMSEYPENESEILKVADYYFNDLNGDWYMTDIFIKWAEARGIDATKIVTIKK